MRKPILIRYGSTTNSNIEESSPKPAAIESRPVGILLFWLRKDKYFLSKESNPFSSIWREFKAFFIKFTEIKLVF